VPVYFGAWSTGDSTQLPHLRSRAYLHRTLQILQQAFTCPVNPFLSYHHAHHAFLPHDCSTCQTVSCSASFGVPRSGYVAFTAADIERRACGDRAYCRSWLSGWTGGTFYRVRRTPTVPLGAWLPLQTLFWCLSPPWTTYTTRFIRSGRIVLPQNIRTTYRVLVGYLAGTPTTRWNMPLLLVTRIPHIGMGWVQCSGDSFPPPGRWCLVGEQHDPTQPDLQTQARITPQWDGAILDIHWALDTTLARAYPVPHEQRCGLDMTPDTVGQRRTPSLHWMVLFRTLSGFL